MAKIERFEDITAWQKARDLCKLIHVFTKGSDFSKDFRLVGQIKGSSGLVMDNIAEGFERDGTREFINFLTIAKGSCGETKSQLYRALDNQYINQEEFNGSYKLADEICKLIAGFIKYLQNTELKGTKFKNR